MTPPAGARSSTARTSGQHHPRGRSGVYSFQFGATGTSNTQVTETIGTGGEAVLYQQVLSNLPVVAGSVSVSDGTYTWSQSGGSSNEDDFSGSFSTNLNRITVNYFSGAPNDGRSIDVTYRYQAEGITGALSSGGEHWLQLTIDGDVQATRERVLAVPFALRAGGLAGPKKKKNHFYFTTHTANYEERATKDFGHDVIPIGGNASNHQVNRFPLPPNCTKVIGFAGEVELVGNSRDHTVEIEVFQRDHLGRINLAGSTRIDIGRGQGPKFVQLPINITVNPATFNFVVLTNWFVVGQGEGQGIERRLHGIPRITYEE